MKKQIIIIELKDTNHTKKLTKKEFNDIITGSLIQVGFKTKLIYKREIK